MGFFNRLRTGSSAARQPTTRQVEATLYDGTQRLDVVGESHYQGDLWRIVGGHRDDYVRHDIVAALVPEPNNRYDSSAVSVQIDDVVVGYLTREDAAEYQPEILRMMRDTGQVVALAGTICGGGDRDGRTGSLGVFLEHDPRDFGLDDLADDQGADPSWQNQLPEADRPAIQMLRDLLAAEASPVDRHFMHAELEHRLYHARDLYAEALDEFDDACRAHDAEMGVIRPALLVEFNGIPVLETYKQACIRLAKAQRWDDVWWWADRGLAIYGENALREEAVEDLTKRRNKAEAKRAL